jgi:hypothetical protein
VLASCLLKTAMLVLQVLPCAARTGVHAVLVAVHGLPEATATASLLLLVMLACAACAGVRANLAQLQATCRQ